MIAIQDGLFRDHYKDLPKKWREFLDALASLVGSILLLLSLKSKESPKPDQESSKNIISTLWDLSGYLLVASVFMVFRATFAAFIGLANTIIWVAVVFTTAGPMILSGLYEATLDRKIIRSMLSALLLKQETVREGGEKGEGSKDERDCVPDWNIFYKRVHQLYAVLVGNLALPEHIHGDTGPEPRTVWKDVRNLVKTEELRELETRQADIIQSKGARAFAEYREVTRVRLKGMLGCQASFGAAIGAPVVFFIGSFLFSVVSNLGVVGDNDTSHALAFGMWWMIIPHVAIVSGCLLAGNNPNTLEVIVCGVGGPWPEDQATKPWWHEWYQPYYQSVYTPVWMWERGRSKREWIDELRIEYSGPSGEGTDAKHGEFHLNLLDWLILFVITFVLMVLPFILAFLTSFYTPTVGLSCRTLNFLLYFLFQVCSSAVWVWNFFRPHRLTRRANWLPFAKKGDADGNNSSIIYYLLLIFVVLGSIFTAFVGTFLQILGVYRNCLCTIPISYWQSRNFSMVISTNTAQDIALANQFWLPTGVASIVLMIVVCYIGWWYQRHWRLQFQTVVDRLLGESDAQVAGKQVSPTGHTTNTDNPSGADTNTANDIITEAPKEPVVTVK
jgi:hypothetical protein